MILMARRSHARRRGTAFSCRRLHAETLVYWNSPMPHLLGAYLTDECSISLQLKVLCKAAAGLNSEFSSPSLCLRRLPCQATSQHCWLVPSRHNSPKITGPLTLGQIMYLVGTSPHISTRLHTTQCLTVEECQSLLQRLLIYQHVKKDQSI